MKKVLNKATAILVMAVVAWNTIVCGGGDKSAILKAHAAENLYVSEIKISYASTKDDAQKELGDEYTILDKDFNDGMKSHAWIGYSTTDDPDMAITDIKVMNMNGGFNYSDYEELLKAQKEAIKAQVDIVVPALIEYAKNYDAGMETAKGIYETLNVYYEDDSEKNLGEFLLNVGRKLAKDSSDSEAIDAVEKIFLQGNDTIVTDIENILTLAQDTKVIKKGTWLTRLSELGPDGLYAVYKQANPKLGSAKIKAQIKKDYDDEAKAILNEIPNLQSIFAEYEKTALAEAVESGNDEEIEEQIEENFDVAVTEDDISDRDDALVAYAVHTYESTDVIENSDTLITAGIVEKLKDTSYGDGTAYEFFTRDDLSAEDLYPVAYVMTKGQKSIMADIGLYGIFESIFAEDNEEAKESLDIGIDEGMLSVYEGVDRSVFESDTAITGEALKRMSTNSDELDDLIGDIAFYGVMVSSMIVTAVAGVKMVQYSKALSKVSAERAVLKMQREAARLYSNQRVFQLSYMQSKGWIADTTDIKAYSKMSNAEQTNILNNAKRNLTQAQKTEIWGLTKVGGKEKLNFVNAKVSEMTGIKVAEGEQLLSKEMTAKMAQNRAAQNTLRKSLIGARVIFVFAAVTAIASAAVEIYNLCSKDNVEFTNIPLNMVDRTYPSGSDAITYVYYSLATTGDYKKADLHNKKGKEWLGIYTTTDDAAGDPIVAGSFTISEEETSANANYEPVALFGEAAGYNLCNKDITGKSVSASYMFFTRDAKSVVQEDLEERYFRFECNRNHNGK